MPGLLSQVNNMMTQNTPALSQVTSTSPSFQPGMIGPAPTPMPNGHLMQAIQRRSQSQQPQQGQPSAPQVPQEMPQPVPGQGPQPEITLPIQDNNPQQPGVQIPVSEATTIIKALTDRLKTISKHEEKVRDAILPSQNGQPIQPA